jgi:Zn-dependent peptidase ImmA (M78 family)/DNA-binding XRE family transcriptional regulator
MNTSFDHLSDQELGERLRKARENAKLKQAEAAFKLDMARTTLISIEQGQRRARFEEVRHLARIYGLSLNALLREEAVHVDLAPRFRKHFGKEDKAVEDAARLLADLAQAEVELENLLGVKRVRNYPAERIILSGDVRAQAEQDATELRQWLGLGLAPIADIVTLLELELGVRVYIRRFDGRISGLFAYDEAIGACILLNANHPRERRTQTGAHEMGHLVSTRRKPEVLERDKTENSREERYATAFGVAFLTPARAVMQKFNEVTAGSEKLTRRHVIILAHAFGVSREAMVRRLEDLHLTKEGTWDWFETYGGITDDQARQVLGDLSPHDAHRADAGRPTSIRLALLAEEASRQGLLSEGQLARMLRLDRVELRKMFDGLQVEGSEADEALLPD